VNWKNRPLALLSVSSLVYSIVYPSVALADLFGKEKYQDEDGNIYTVSKSPIRGYNVRSQDGSATHLDPGLIDDGKYHDADMNVYKVRQTIAGRKQIEVMPGSANTFQPPAYSPPSQIYPAMTPINSSDSYPAVPSKLSTYQRQSLGDSAWSGFEAGRQMAAQAQQASQQDSQLMAATIMGGIQLLSRVFSNGASSQPQTPPSPKSPPKPQAITKQRTAFSPPNNNFASTRPHPLPTSIASSAVAAKYSVMDGAEIAKKKNVLLEDWYSRFGPKTKSKITLEEWKQLRSNIPLETLEDEFQDFRRYPNKNPDLFE